MPETVCGGAFLIHTTTLSKVLAVFLSCVQDGSQSLSLPPVPSPTESHWVLLTRGKSPLGLEKHKLLVELQSPEKQAESLPCPHWAAWCGLPGCWVVGLSIFISGWSMEPILLLPWGFSAQL